jgi:uncharacterized linocin/CFP29 family protein
MKDRLLEALREIEMIASGEQDTDSETMQEALDTIQSIAERVIFEAEEQEEGRD